MYCGRLLPAAARCSARGIAAVVADGLPASVGDVPPELQTAEPLPLAPAKSACQPRRFRTALAHATSSTTWHGLSAASVYAHHRVAHSLRGPRCYRRRASCCCLQLPAAVLLPRVHPMVCRVPPIRNCRSGHTPKPRFRVQLSHATAAADTPKPRIQDLTFAHD